MDPFMGSGSTAEACLRNGRPVFGIEIKLEYVEMAAERLERYLRAKKAQEQLPQLPFNVKRE